MYVDVANAVLDKLFGDPARELVAIVRCKDCRHYPKPSQTAYREIVDEYGFECPIAHRRMFREHFCDCGETDAEYVRRNGRTVNDEN